MPAVQRHEVRAGLVAWLDNAVLRACPGVLTNGRATIGDRRGVDRDGPFLVLSVSQNGEMCRCAPLFTHARAERVKLQAHLKTGPGAGWRERDSFYSRHEHWMIPLACFEAASAIERSAPGARQRYGVRSPAVLSAIEVDLADPGAPFAPIADR